jgi:hypothetical protein
MKANYQGALLNNVRFDAKLCFWSLYLSKQSFKIFPKVYLALTAGIVYNVMIAWISDIE